MNKLFRNRKTRARNLFLLLLPLILIIGLLSVIAYQSLTNFFGDESGSYSGAIETEGIYLRAGSTDLQKTIFKDLKKAYEAEEEDPILLATLTGESFIADYFTWSNKAGSYDIGGMYYVDSYNSPNFLNQSRDTFYKYVSYYINEYGVENLLKVSSIECVKAEDSGPFTINRDGEDYTFDSYSLEFTWTYEDNEVFPAAGYQNSATMLVVKKDYGRYEVINFYGDF